MLFLPSFASAELLNALFYVPRYWVLPAMRNTCGVAHLVAFLVCEVVDRFSKTPKGEGRVLQFPIVDVGGNYPLKKKIARASVLCFFFIAISPAALDYRNSSLNRKELAAVAARKCAPLPSAPVQFQPAFPACWPCESEKKKKGGNECWKMRGEKQFTSEVDGEGRQT